MKSFLSKIFAIAVVVVLLMATVATPAYAMSLPGQGDFWDWFGGQTGTRPSTAPAQTPAPTPQPTPEPTPEPTDSPAESSAAAAEQATDATVPAEATAAAAEGAVLPEATAAAAVTETVAPAPEATQPAGNVYIDNSVYNDNRIIYYMPEGEKMPEATPEPTAPQREFSEGYEVSYTYKRSFLGIEFEVDENGHLTSGSRLKIFGIFAAICLGVALLAYIGFFEYLKFGLQCKLEDIRDWFYNR